ncbi:ParE toxin of type II toxin-antitoxin system, parDE [Salinibacillus kushneri]|uniref:ParE toxin of type II toxin-antitoxin system, parDE n=1 Tax=Salinibacillus kushneri TaxID=237682 RepID=A0A1I0H8S7_9BACI|nr:type II toxin-antitoxin system RelE/ParE family toxin [Salinibacillus kushneri]SET80071.1 ParE toxin of type II toxin-antitoxin system, parDE [Salinibacillus kushneri]
MVIKWTNQALGGFRNIQSHHFTFQETKEYKRNLVKKIEEKIALFGTSIPADKPEWEGSYKIIIDKYIIYYSLSDNRTTCYIEYFKHSRQQR